MRTAPVKAIALPAVYRANLEFQSHVPFQHPRTRVIDSRKRGRRGFCTLVHSLCKKLPATSTKTHTIQDNCSNNYEENGSNSDCHNDNNGECRVI